MRVTYLIMPLICIVISLIAFSGAFAACIQADCSEAMEPGSCGRAVKAYEECKRLEKAEKEKKEAVEREQRQQAGRETPEGDSKTQYPWMEDLRQR